MTDKREVYVVDIIDAAKLSPFQIAVFVLFGMFLVMDGFDVQAMGYVAPALIDEWGIPNASMTPVFMSGLFGLFVGSMFFGMVGDRVGRRRVLLSATAAFSVLTLACAAARSPTELMVIRFFAGLGLGAILPNATALIGEFSPQRIRVAMMMIVTNGFTVGAMLGGFLSAWLIPEYGWRAVFYVGGTVPLLLLVPMYKWLPESLQFLALRRNEAREIAKWLKRIDPSAAVDAATRFLVREQTTKGVPLVRLFADKRAIGTTLIWIANFLNVLNAYFVSSWLPTIVRDSGYSTVTGVLVGTSVQTGGVIGTIVIALILHRIGFIPMLTACFAIAATSLALLGPLLGEPSLTLPLLFAVAFLTGWGIFGGQPTLNALSASYYPTDLRSTGIGAGLGIGRIGAIIGPFVAGELMRAQWGTESIFYAAAVPAVLATLSVLIFARAVGKATPQVATAFAAHH